VYSTVLVLPVIKLQDYAVPKLADTGHAECVSDTPTSKRFILISKLLGHSGSCFVIPGHSGLVRVFSGFSSEFRVHAVNPEDSGENVRDSGKPGENSGFVRDLGFDSGIERTAVFTHTTTSTF
jgi:hypothetical protein